MKITLANASSAPPAVGGYSQALAVSDPSRFVFVSGQIPETLTGDVPDDFKSQAELVWANLLAQLAAAGMTVENLVKVTIFLSSRKYSAENAEARRAALRGHAPALTVIITGIFDERWLLEIEAIAAA